MKVAAVITELVPEGPGGITFVGRFCCIASPVLSGPFYVTLEAAGGNESQTRSGIKAALVEALAGHGIEDLKESDIQLL